MSGAELAPPVQVRVVELGGRFAPQARERIQQYLQSFVSFEPVLGLLYSDVSGQGSWSMAAFAQQTVDELTKMYGSFGAAVCYNIDGLQAVIPQVAHIDELDSGVLDFAGNRLVRVPPAQS
jgi:hypothetical protein